jgi:hypothetical protein
VRRRPRTACRDRRDVSVQRNLQPISGDMRLRVTIPDYDFTTVEIRNLNPESHVSGDRLYYSVKRDLLQCQKRPTTVSKETYKCDVIRGLRAETGETLVSERDLLQCKKIPTTVSKEPYYSVKREYLHNSTIVSKVTYYRVKRDLRWRGDGMDKHMYIQLG